MLTVDRQAFTRALKTVQPAVAKTSNFPALYGIHLQTHDDVLRVTASNLDVTITTTLACTPGPFDVTAAASTLSRIVGAGRGGDLTLTADDGTLRITAGVQASMRTIADGFPDVADLGADAVEAQLTAEDMESVARVAHAASLDQTRPLLTGVHFTAGHVEATDSYRLARATISDGLPEMLVTPDVMRSVLDHAVAPVDVRCDGKRAQFTSGATTWITQMIPTEQPYPDTTRLLDSIADKLTASVTVSALDLIDVLDRIKSLGTVDARSPAILAATDGLLTARRTVTDVGDIADVIAADGDMGEMRLHPAYLADAVEHARCDEVTLRTVDPMRPLLIETDGYVAACMPVRTA